MTGIGAQQKTRGFSLQTKKSAVVAPKRNLVLAGEDEFTTEQNGSTAIESFDLQKRNEKPPEIARIIEGPRNTWGTHRRKRARSESIEASDDDSNNEPRTADKYGLLVSSPQRATKSDNLEPRQDANKSKETSYKPDVEDAAMDALLGRTSSYTVIAPPSPPPTEEELFHKDFRNAPPPATLQEYTATPVEGFGAALLRGQMPKGKTLETYTAEWEAKQPSKKKPKGIEEDVKRGYRLGIGAKASGLKAEEDDRRNGRREKPQAFTGLAMKNKRTGEIISEEDLAARRKMLEEQSESSDHRRGRNERDEDRDRKWHRGDDRERRLLLDTEHVAHREDSGRRRARDDEYQSHGHHRSKSHRERRDSSGESDHRKSRRRDGSGRERSRDGREHERGHRDHENGNGRRERASKDSRTRSRDRGHR